MGWRHLSTGDLLRENRLEGTELGREAQSFMDQGELVPDHLILAMVAGEISGLGPEDGVILDGFPRTTDQARGLSDVLAGVGRKVDRVVVIEADDVVLVQRLAGRRSCPRCAAIYNVHFNKPVEDDACDRCGARGLVHRPDDRPDTVRNRLDVYRRQTAPLVEFYLGDGARLERVRGDRPMEEVQEAIRTALQEGRAGST